MHELRLGLVGAGAWGRNYIRTLNRLDGLRLAAAATRDWQKLVDESLDGVVVATPPATHLAIARHFVASGVPVLIEKPLCLDLKEALEFRELAARSRALVMVNHLHLFSMPFRLLKRWVGSLGPIRTIRCAGGRKGPFRADVPALWDWGSHDIAMIIDLLGRRPSSIAGKRLLAQSVDGALAENHQIDLAFDSGATARVVTGSALFPVRRLEIDCAGGSLVYDDMCDDKLIVDLDDPELAGRLRAEIARQKPFRPPLDCALESFGDAIRAGDRNQDQLELALGVIKVLDAIGRMNKGDG
jgi:predicted dehydrogenase